MPQDNESNGNAPATRDDIKRLEKRLELLILDTRHEIKQTEHRVLDAVLAEISRRAEDNAIEFTGLQKRMDVFNTHLESAAAAINLLSRDMASLHLWAGNKEIDDVKQAKVITDLARRVEALENQLRR